MTRRSGSTGRSRTGSKLLPFIRLARPHFLVGGFLLYGLGAAIARYEGTRINAVLYALGQVFVTSLQLMTHFLNEYWDVDTDRANTNRTFFSGGSGVLSTGLLDLSTARLAARACLAVSLASGFSLIVVFHAFPAAWPVMLIALAGAWFYSSPPIRLASSGFGELTASLLVAFLLPAFGHLLQSGTLTLTLIWATSPLVAFNFAMLLAFDLPDVSADEASGKRTLLVRLGVRRGVLAHEGALLAAYGLLAWAALAGVPLLIVLSGAVAFPLALAQALQFLWLADDRRGFGWLTLGAVALFTVTAGLITFGFWRLG
ncbi:MAG: prenyltransferase [Chloroflexi bacterium]|nr:prenyltransferase [Chloroflexota bacterium]